MSKILSVLSGIAVIVLLVVLGGTLIGLADSRAQIGAGTRASVGTAFTYQGHLTEGQSPADGRYDFTFALYDDPDEGSPVGPTLSEVVTVTNSLFSVELDFGSVFDGTALWLEIGVRPEGDTDPHTPLLPRQRLTAAPFATFANSAASAPWTGLTGVPAGFADDIDDDTLYQAGEGLDLVDTTFAITLTYQLPQECEPDQFIRWTGTGWACTEAGTGITGWSLSGNSGTTPGADFLGTTDDAALQLHVNGNRALRLEPDGTSPNIVGGYGGNDVGPGTSGATIGGGGRDLAINAVSADFGTVGGGAGNTATAYGATVGGGEANSAGDSYAAIGGGLGNTAGGARSTVAGGSSNTAGWDYATVSGGSGNTADAAVTAIGGGAGNLTSGTYGTIAGGLQNQAGGTAAAIGGGESNTTSADHAAVGGGYFNAVSATFGTIAGGGPTDSGNPTTTNNRVYDEYGAIGGGGGNSAGFEDSSMTSQRYATVAGGETNAASNSYATVGGGTGNGASGYASTVGGGTGNSASNNYATVGGGTNNSAGNNYAAVGGGDSNNVTGLYGTIPGGRQNAVGGTFGFAAGMQAHAEHNGTFVWSSSPGVFASTGPGQFLIDASGGVGIGTDSPVQMLTVQGSAEMLSSDAVSVSVVYSHSRTLDAPNALYAAGDLLYVTSYSTNTLSIWNVSNPEKVEPVGYTTSNLLRPTDIFVSGQRAYVTSESNNRLVAFDLSNPSAPDSLGSTGEGLANPIALYVAGKYAYVVSDGPGTMDGLAIFDVSDPTHMRLRDDTNVGMVAPTDVFVAGSRAYVTSMGNNSLVIYDVSDPRPGQIQALGSVTGPMYAPRAVFVSGPYAYVVSDSDDLVIFDISNPDSIVTAGSTSTNLSNPLDVFITGDLAYVASSGNDRLAIFDISDPANIADLGFAETGDKPVSLFVAGKQVYVANETGNSVSLYEATHLQAPTLQTGSLQTGNLDVIDNATVSNDLAVHGGLQVGASGARIGGALSVTGPDDSYILGALSVGGAGALISDTVYLTRTQWMTAPTHALDVIGEGRFRVNDYTNLVLRSANAGSDEDAYVDFIRSDQTTVLTPSARIEFDAADPLTHTTGIRFYTQGRDDTEMLSRLEITSRGDVRPGADGVYLLGIPGRLWHTVYSVNGIQTGSDGRYKENVSALPYGLDEVKALHPVMFTWIEHPDDGPYYGLIAQEVRQVLPDIVRGDEGEDGMLGMNYSELVPVLVKAVQEQQAEIESQAEQIAGLETRLDALEKAQPTRTDQPGALNLLATFGIGGLMLGAVWVAGTRRRGGQS
jgi:hypothetical protein